MGYNTDFDGSFKLNKRIEPMHQKILDNYASDDSRGADPQAPDSYCQWVVSSDGMSIEWDGGEKFYEYVEWITYLVDNLIKPWGYVLNGEVAWDGEERGDIGTIVIKDNEVAIEYR